MLCIAFTTGNGFADFSRIDIKGSNYIELNFAGGIVISESTTISNTVRRNTINSNSNNGVLITGSAHGNTVGGTWTATFANPAFNDAGTVSGQLSGSSLQVMLNSGDPTACPLNVTATVASASISGTYTSVNCTVAFGGSINLTR